jgi:hypothetical protein
MAVLASIASGNLTTSTTWGLVDSTSYLNSETGSEILTTAYTGTRSSAFTPGAITISHIGVKLSVRTGTTGSVSVELYNNTGAAAVAGTEVTIDCADLPVAATADLNGGWIMFKLASPVTLAGATSYSVEAKTTSASQVSLFRDGTTDNIARILVTTTTQAPVAGDDMIIAGEYVDASTFNTFTVTMNETATTDYGAASTSLVTPSLAICNGGTLQYGTTAATNYYLRQSGNLIVYSGGTLNIGTTGTPIPRDSTAILNFDCGANVDFGLIIRNLGTFNAQGLSRTSGKNIVSCKLNTDEAVNSTSLGVDTDTGWLDNDEIAIASTTRTASQCEKGTLNGAAGASSLTVDGFAGAGGGLAFAHSGTSPTQAEVILLTRNVKVFGASATLQAYVDIKATAIVDCDWVEFYWLGSSTSTKRGIDVNTTTGVCTFHYCSRHTSTVASSRGWSVGALTGTGITISYCVTFNIANVHLNFNTFSTHSIVVDNCIFMRNTDTSEIVFVGGAGVTGGSAYTFSNITVIGCASSDVGFSGFRLSGTLENHLGGSISNITSHSNNASGVAFNGGLYGVTMSNITVWRNNSSGFMMNTNSTGTCIRTILISDLVAFGNGSTNLSIQTSAGNITLVNPVFNGDTTFSTPIGISTSFGHVSLKIINGDFSTVSGIKNAHTSDIDIGSNTTGLIVMQLNNTKLGASTEVANQTGLADSTSYISSQKHDQTAGLHKTWKKYGTIETETTTVQSGSNSFKMTPNNASNKLESGSFFIAVASGAALTPSVYVYEDGTYNGARARLILKRNDAIGITSDTVIDTATASSDEAWEQLTGTTATATDNGVMEFVVDCDGTAGNLFVDTFTVS